MKIYLAADHAGFELKERAKKWLIENGHEVTDCGALKLVEGDDYPVYMAKAAEAVASNPGSQGIIFGGSGQGEAMVANRQEGVRAAVFYGPELAKTAVDSEGKESSDPYEIVRLERSHNDANMLSLGARFLNPEEALAAIKIFLETPFSQAERHDRRIKEF
jgi:ribose 5-phosphate isomerase B